MLPTLREIVAKSAAYLAGAGLTAPRLEAELLIGAAIGLDRIQLYVQYDRPLAETEIQTMRELLRARAKERVPIAYLTGRKYFLGHALSVPRGVFIPRPETEELVEAAVTRLSAIGVTQDQPLEILDLCTGTGAISLALAKKYGRATILAVDLSPLAVRAAEDNVKRFQLEGRLTVRQGDLWEAVPQNRVFDLIISNPPYIPSALIAGLPAEIREHEPHLALDGGEDGLLFYHRILSTSGRYLRPGGLVALEHGEDQGRPIADLARHYGLDRVAQHDDLSGCPRILLAQKESSS
ncbi:MAG: peptide chain release factor N(5)-glutamine methyltransferase [Bacteroidota bacterium]